MLKICLLIITTFSSLVFSEEFITLEDAIKRGVEGDESVQYAYYERARVRQYPKNAITDILPNINIYADLERNKYSGVFYGEAQKNAVIEYSQTFFNMEALSDYKGSKFLVTSQERRYMQTVEDISFEIACIYFDVIKYEQLFEVADSAKGLAEQNVRMTASRYDAGLVPEIDYSQAKVEMSQSWRNWVAARNDLVVIKLAIYHRLKLKDSYFILEEPVDFYNGEFDDNVSIKDYVAQASLNRHDIVAQRELGKAGKWNVISKKRQYWPTLEGVVRQKWNYPVSSYDSNNEWRAILRLEWSLFEGGSKLIGIRDAKYGHRQEQVMLEKQLLDLEMEIEQTVFMGKTVRETINVLKKEVEWDQSNYEVISQHYNLGKATNLDLIAAFHRLINARSELANKEYEYRVLTLKLRKQLGEIW